MTRCEFMACWKNVSVERQLTRNEWGKGGERSGDGFGEWGTEKKGLSCELVRLYD